MLVYVKRVCTPLEHAVLSLSVTVKGKAGITIHKFVYVAFYFSQLPHLAVVPGFRRGQENRRIGHHGTLHIQNKAILSGYLIAFVGPQRLGRQGQAQQQ